MRPTRLDYCQYLLVSPLNHTLTNFADHSENISHDAMNRLLSNERMTPRMVWDNVGHAIEFCDDGCLVFDDTIVDKDYSHKIELVRRQYSGNAHGVIKGIGVVTCVYVHPRTGQYWVMDYRIFDPAGDGKSKLDHVREMLANAVHARGLPFRTVLMDTWYATCELMKCIESLGKVYYCPLKDNRLVNDSEIQAPYQRVDSLRWNEPKSRTARRSRSGDFPRTTE